MNKGVLGLLWFVAVAFVLLIAFGIGQPFIWHFINETPPAATMAFSSLLTIIITLLVLGITAFGGGTYYILSRRIRQEAAEAAETEYLDTLVRLRSHVSALWGRLYEGLQNIIPQEELIAFVNQAVNYAEQADLDTRRLDAKIHEGLILMAKNNYAMALALKGDPGTAKTAVGLVNYILQKTENYPPQTKASYKETCGFVAWRLPRKADDSRKAAKYLKEASSEATEVQKRLWKRRWKRFPKNKFRE